MTDIRPRDWMSLDTRVSKLLRLLIEVEDELTDLFDYQNDNNGCYPSFENFYNQVGDIRSRFADYIDNHKELLTMDDEINAYFKRGVDEINK